MFAEKMSQELPDLETKETKPVARTMTATELVGVIYKTQSLPQDNRFLPTNRGGVFEYFNLADLTGLSAGDKLYPVVLVADKIVGLAELEKNPRDPKIFWIKFISVDPSEQGKGFATKLTREIFRFAKENDLALETSSYSEVGYQKLKDLFSRLAQEYSVRFIDTERKLN